MAQDLSALNGPIGATSQTAGFDVCDRCPQPEFASTARFGCDIVTKTCKCGVPSLLRTTCINNDECRFSGASCDVIDNFFERDVFGSISCEECSTDRICLVSPGEATGFCSCATQPVPYATCEETARGQLVSPPVFSMCMVALGAAAHTELKTSATYRIEGSKLATVRCDMLDGSTRYCISVEMGPGMAPTFIVGLDNLFSRRLLQMADSNSSESAFYRFVVPPETYDLALRADWSRVHTPICRPVPRLFNSSDHPLSLTDDQALRSCVRWRSIGIEIVHMTNISNDIPDTFLIGPEDFAYEIVAHPSRLYMVKNHGSGFVQFFTWNT